MKSPVYLYVSILEGPGNYFRLNINDYIDIIYFNENNGFAHL